MMQRPQISDWLFFLKLVEMAGIEPASENFQTKSLHV